MVFWGAELLFAALTPKTPAFFLPPPLGAVLPPPRTTKYDGGNFEVLSHSGSVFYANPSAPRPRSRGHSPLRGPILDPGRSDLGRRAFCGLEPSHHRRARQAGPVRSWPALLRQLPLHRLVSWDQTGPDRHRAGERFRSR